MTITSLATLAQYDSNHILMASINDDAYSPAEKQFFLDQATTYIESQAYQSFRAAEYIETLRLGNTYCSVDEYGFLNVLPKYFPLTDVETLEYRVTPGGDWITFDDDTYSIGDPRVITVPFNNPLVPRMWAEVRVTYTAGYDDDAIPNDLIFACCLVAAYFMSAGYAAVSIQGTTVQSVLPKWAWDVVNATVNKYQRQF